MRITGAFGLSLSLAAAVAVQARTSLAKGAEEGRVQGWFGAAASSAEVAKLKAVRLGDPKAGTFKWGMKPEEVMAQVRAAVEAKYEPRIDKAQARIPACSSGFVTRWRARSRRSRRASRSSRARRRAGTFRSSGQEFQQNTAEAVLVTKEDVWTRYFFFFEDGLYKMFLGFNKDAIGGKNFEEFGKGMEAKYGNAREVFRDDKVKAAASSAPSITTSGRPAAVTPEADRSLRVLRRVLPGAVRRVVQDRVVERRKVVNPGDVKRDELVESVTAKDKAPRDSNDDIIDRVVGKEVKKPGDEKHADIVVPSQTARPCRRKTSTPRPLRRRRRSRSSSSASERRQEEGRQEVRQPDGRPRAVIGSPGAAPLRVGGKTRIDRLFTRLCSRFWGIILPRPNRGSRRCGDRVRARQRC